MAAGVNLQPFVDVLGCGDAVELLGSHPAAAWHQGGDGGGVREQDLSPVCQADLGAGDGDLRELHGSDPLTTPLR